MLKSLATKNQVLTVKVRWDTRYNLQCHDRNRLRRIIRKMPYGPSNANITFMKVIKSQEPIYYVFITLLFNNLVLVYRMIEVYNRFFPSFPNSLELQTGVFQMIIQQFYIFRI